ncbi:MAG TPA: tetratricopeptide repeat protein [Bryobacteraceae bacterium]|nr:tetratricopeptide repeat protein [Bryobacteraceae bacterium]
MKLLSRAVASLLVVLAAAVAQTPAFDELAVQANAARQASDVPKAMGLYRRALEIKPDWPEGWWFLGTLAYDSDRYADGESAFSQFVKLDDKNPMAWGFLGLCEFETGGYQRSLEHIRRAFEIGSVEPSIEQVLRFHEVLLLDKLGLFDQAMPKLRPFVRRGTKNNVLLAAIGLTALRRPLLPQEIPAAEQPLIAAAGQAAYFWMAGEDGSTASAFKILLENYPQAPGVHYLYGTYLLASRPAEEAYAEFRRELEVNPHSADARATIALLMVRAGGEPAALPLAKQAAQDGPSCPMAQYAYGLILGSAGNFEEAIKRLETAVRLDPSSVEYHMGLAGAYSRAGRAKDARRERQLSIALARESDESGSR